MKNIGSPRDIPGKAATPSRSIRLISTTEDERWVERTDIAFNQASLSGKGDVVVALDDVQQIVNGFGGTFNELGWDALQALPPDGQDKVIGDLFGADGLHLAVARTPVGASDYALSYYSYCDVKDDYAMRDFSTARDRYILVPYIKKALLVRPDLKIWASPWTPPAWMKINEHYTLRGGGMEGRAGGNEMDARKNVMNNATAFNMQVGYLQAYALYLSKYVQEYQKEGVRLWAIMPQNEISCAPNWPCCTWRSDDLALFIGKYLGPEFEKEGVEAEIWLGTINDDNPDYVRTVLKDGDATEYVKGIGFQWAGGKAIGAIHAEYPAYELMQTENMCGDGENNWESLENSWATVVHYFNNNVSSYMYWNMVLDETGRSSWGWPQNSLVVIDRQTGRVRYTDEYYLMKHLSHFVQPGARRLGTSDGENTLAFRLADGRIAVVVCNPDKSEKEVGVVVGDKSAKVALKAKSINTLVFEGHQ